MKNENKIIISDIKCPICNMKPKLERFMIDTYGKDREIRMTCECGCSIDWAGRKEVVITVEDWEA